MRSPEELERATDICCQLHYLGEESLTNLLHSVIAELGRKGGISEQSQATALYALDLLDAH